jgi:glutamine cyclotransferase
MRFVIVLSFTISILISCDKKTSEIEGTSDSLSMGYAVLRTIPHDVKNFTEGIVMYDNKILESTGLNGQSWIAEVDPTTGQSNKKVILDNRYFGEGITVLNKKIYQLTYQEKTGFIYEVSTYKKMGEFNYETEGWGITHDNKNLIMSDGTDKLYFLDTLSLQVNRTLSVTDLGRRVKKLNELEFCDGYIFANVWETSLIVKIDPANGNVVGRLDLSRLTNDIKRMYPESDVLNGIAFDQNLNALLVTGKYWPLSYLITVK